MKWRRYLERVPPAVLLTIWAFAIVTALVAVFVPFPSNYDELQHLSVVRAQFEHPSLFADPSRYLVLREDDPTRWSATRNYINHPSLYYLLMSAYLHITDSILVARGINVALAVATLAMIVWAGLRQFANRFDQAGLAVLAASFPKAALIGGMVNNDNLAGLAGAIVFAGLMGANGWMLGIGLALAGWTKLTALIALGTVVLAGRAWCIARDRERWTRDMTWIIVGLGIGAIPYIASLIASGHLFYVNEGVYAASPAHRVSLDPGSFARFFFQMLAMKWSASEYSLPLWIAVALLAVPLVLAAIGIARDRAIARICLPYATAIAVTLTIHFCFGWSAFARIGDQTIAQTRYYNVLWPGVALAAAAGVAQLHRHSRVLAVATLALCVAPTIVGGVLLAFFAR